MRLILIGCEYVGKTTLANSLRDWGVPLGKHFHMDDGDFTIPDCNMSPEDQKTMLNLSPVLKERFQRMVIFYHIDVLTRSNDCILGGYHIEEKIYGPRYYHPDIGVSYHRFVETQLPSDTILVNMKADSDVIKERMKSNSHPYQLVQSHEVDEIQDEFLYEFQQSNIERKIELDTSKLTPETILDTFLNEVRPVLTPQDMYESLDAILTEELAKRLAKY
tara:strand:+ start:170 stop:826 length:657 start_codon:yes stop_codon:yes gene_type:complete